MLSARTFAATGPAPRARRGRGPHPLAGWAGYRSFGPPAMAPAAPPSRLRSLTAPRPATAFDLNVVNAGGTVLLDRTGMDGGGAVTLPVALADAVTDVRTRPIDRAGRNLIATAQADAEAAHAQRDQARAAQAAAQRRADVEATQRADAVPSRFQPRPQPQP